MNNFYLAHSFQLLEKVRKWQIMIEGKYNINFINPFVSNPFENGRKLKTIHTKKSLIKYQKEMGIDKCCNIMDRDLSLIRKSDGVVAYFEKFTAGTVMEIFAAAYLYRIPVYIISYNHGYHCWLRALAYRSGGKLFRNRKEFKLWLNEKSFKKV